MYSRRIDVFLRLLTISAMKGALSFFVSIGIGVAGIAAPLKVGNKAPALEAQNESGGKVHFDEIYKASRFTLVYFFPMATCENLCTIQAQSVRDAHEKLDQLGVTVIAVSHDNVAVQKEFRTKNALPFMVISDEDESVSKAFGVENIEGTRHAERQAFLVKDGNIVWFDAKSKTGAFAQEVIRVATEENRK